MEIDLLMVVGGFSLHNIIAVCFLAKNGKVGLIRECVSERGVSPSQITFPLSCGKERGIEGVRSMKKES
jgi:hypothetical protein